MGGFLIPSWYEAEVPSKLSLEFVTFLFGFSTACAVFTAVTIIQQAHRAWHRKKNLFAHTYIMMVSVEWLSSVIISVVSFLFVIAVIPPSFWLFFGILCLWVLQIQCIMHIIINRIALIIYDAKRVRRMKVAATLLIGAINITVFVIWMPARLQINSDWMILNSTWDRIEKGILALLDLGLNLYFIYLVRSELIAHGLTKYRYLFWFNIGMIFISISLDILLIGIMSLPVTSTFIYVQFHPLMYLIKLKIEMNMADLIVKIVRASSPPQGHELHRYAASNPAAAASPGARSAAGSRNPSDTFKKSSQGTAASNGSQTQIIQSTPASSSSCPPYAEQQQKPQSTSLSSSSPNKSAPAAARAWELTRMPSTFSAEDVVDQRKVSVAEGMIVGGGGGGGGDHLVVTGFAPVRPAFTRNMSEMTELEIGAGYLNPSCKERKMGAEHSPC